MTHTLELAINQLRTLPEDTQEAIAAIILAEIEQEQLWEETFAHSQDLLANLAASAMAEYHAGKTQELDPDTL